MKLNILTSISGVSWHEAYQEHEKGNYGNAPVNFIGRKKYILNKKSSGRKKDLADVEALGEQ